jgi:hypothetical protein
VFTNWRLLNSLQLRRLDIEDFQGITRLDLAVGDTTVLVRESNRQAVFIAMCYD